ncbi:MAG: Rrf2 family transcriptional regulator [Phycisphaeraceae bacterium]|nr:Rrf2 family transcriptional regulator [Phycisphaeraceae bacterium]
MSFNLTRKTDYALVALAALAEEADGDAEALSARQIAETHRLPASLLMNVLKQLHRAGILCSRRGAGGGYSLCREPEQISLLEVIEAIEGPVKVALCCEEEPDNGQAPCSACSVEESCPIKTPMQRFDEMVRSFLAGVSLVSLIQDPKQISASLEVRS